MGCRGTVRQIVQVVSRARYVAGCGGHAGGGDTDSVYVYACFKFPERLGIIEAGAALMNASERWRIDA
jgi:hypothetical protein